MDYVTANGAATQKITGVNANPMLKFLRHIAKRTFPIVRNYSGQPGSLLLHHRGPVLRYVFLSPWPTATLAFDRFSWAVFPCP